MASFYVHWMCFLRVARGSLTQWGNCHFVVLKVFWQSTHSLFILIITSMVFMRDPKIRRVDNWQELYVKRVLKNWHPYVLKITVWFERMWSNQESGKIEQYGSDTLLRTTIREPKWGPLKKQDLLDPLVKGSSENLQRLPCLFVQ